MVLPRKTYPEGWVWAPAPIACRWQCSIEGRIILPLEEQLASAKQRLAELSIPFWIVPLGVVLPRKIYPEGWVWAPAPHLWCPTFRKSQ